MTQQMVAEEKKKAKQENAGKNAGGSSSSAAAAAAAVSPAVLATANGNTPGSGAGKRRSPRSKSVTAPLADVAKSKSPPTAKRAKKN
jgi:hypothetical protein